MHPTPYLFFNGTCRDAIEFYADVFSGDIEMMAPYSDLPPGEGMDVPPEKASWVMHCSLLWPDGGRLMASDIIDGDQPAMAGSSISMALADVETGRRAFDRLAEGGDVGMPYQETFWTPGFGTVSDKFGTRWMVTVA